MADVRYYLLHQPAVRCLSTRNKDSNQNTLIVPILVSPPLYKRTWMIALYILLLVIITVGIVTLFSERKRKRLLKQYEEEQKKHVEELQHQAYEQLQEKVRNQESELKNRMRFLTQNKNCWTLFLQKWKHKRMNWATGILTSSTSD